MWLFLVIYCVRNVFIMNILLIMTKGDIGGVSVFALNLARKLTENGDSVTVGFGDGDFLPKELDEIGIPHVRFKYLKRTHNPFANIFFIKEIKEYVNEHSFDVVHFNSSNSLFGSIGIKRASSKPKIVFTIHGLSFLDPNYHDASWIMKKVYFFLFSFLLRFVDTSIFVSKINKEVALRSGLISKGEVIYNAVHSSQVDFLSRDDAMEIIVEMIKKRTGKFPEGIKKSDMILGSIGRLAYQKNYEFLIKNFSKILKKHNDAFLIILGEGPKRKNYEDLIVSLGLEEKIFLPGEISQASRYITAFDLFVLPSVYEGLPITLLEVLFSDVPILATDVGGNSEAVNDSQEQLYCLDNAQDFLKKTDDLLFNKKIRTVLAIKNSEYSKCFGVNEMASRYRTIYQT